GAVLVPKLLAAGYAVKVLDLYIYGDHVLDAVADDPHLQQIKGDIRDRALLQRVLPGCNAVIHLACISNDPSFDLDPDLGRSINYDCFQDLVDVSKGVGVRRFVFASSSSVYGIKEDDHVTEDMALEPLTDYSKYKALCEEDLHKARETGFTTLILRPATVCGYSPRLRLDLTVNILTNHAVNNGKITVFGGEQKRPNIHIDDVTDLYVKSLEWPAQDIDGQVFNAGYENHKVIEIAEMIRAAVARDVDIEVTPTDDHRSYHISSERIRSHLGYMPQRSIGDAVQGLVTAFDAGHIPDSFTDDRYFNIRMMQGLRLA
ncbi:MAG: SDR family oxidoreductase, partial [Gemmatimonadetes bacterium]|nr:SDR family oxidoreductase [Gemmatimonadota bacterium]